MAAGTTFGRAFPRAVDKLPLRKLAADSRRQVQIGKPGQSEKVSIIAGAPHAGKGILRAALECKETENEQNCQR